MGPYLKLRMSVRGLTISNLSPTHFPKFLMISIINPHKSLFNSFGMQNLFTCPFQNANDKPGSNTAKELAKQEHSDILTR